MLKSRSKEASDYAQEHPWCEACGQHASSEVHHIARRSLPGTEDEENFLALCLWCHKRYHDHGWQTFVKDFPHIEPKIQQARAAHGLKGSSTKLWRYEP